MNKYTHKYIQWITFLKCFLPKGDYILLMENLKLINADWRKEKVRRQIFQKEWTTDKNLTLRKQCDRHEKGEWEKEERKGKKGRKDTRKKWKMSNYKGVKWKTIRK